MCVSCFLRPPCFPQALSRHHRSEALSTAVCLCTRACLWMCLRGVEGISNLANRCIIFGMVAPSLRRASLKSLGSLHPIHSTPPPPPPLAQTLGVKPSMAQLGSLTAATAAAQNLLDLWPVHGPVPTAPHYTAHRWLHHLLEIAITGVHQVFEGIPPCGRAPCSCFRSKLILMMRHRLTIDCSSYLIPKILGWILFSVWSDQAPRKPHGINLAADVSGWRVWSSTFSLGCLIGWVYAVGV